MTYQPSKAEIDAGEKVLAEATNSLPDGYWRSTVEDVLIAAHKESWQAMLKGLDGIAMLDAEIAGYQESDRARRSL